MLASHRAGGQQVVNWRKWLSGAGRYMQRPKSPSGLTGDQQRSAQKQLLGANLRGAENKGNAGTEAASGRPKWPYARITNAHRQSQCRGMTALGRTSLQTFDGTVLGVCEGGLGICRQKGSNLF